MDKGLFEILLNKTEGKELDFKESQYKMDTEDHKAEFIKDVLAFANAWKTSDAYIICGIVDDNCKAGERKGITDHLIDNNLQKMVCSKTNRPPEFRYEQFEYEGKEFGIIIISKCQNRPIYLKKNYEKLKAEQVYIRRGSSTDIASPEEIAKMGESSFADEPPILDILLKDKENGTIIEKDVFLKSTILVIEIPPTKPENSAEIKATQEEQNLDSELKQIKIILNNQLNFSDIFSDPDYPEKFKDYLQAKKIFTPISFVMQNKGSSTAYDVKTEVRIKKLECVKIFSSYHFLKPPSKNKFDLSELTLPILNKDIEGEIISEETEDEYIFEIKFGKIQPKDISESRGFLYIGAGESLEFEMLTKTFADNLPEPIEKTFNFRIEVNEENYKPEEYEL